jgi:hypothetical protein
MTPRRRQTSGKSLDSLPHLISVQSNIACSLVERAMPVQIFQLNEAHARSVRKATKGPAKIVMRDPA